MDIGLIDINDFEFEKRPLPTKSSFANIYKARNKQTGEIVIAKQLKDANQFKINKDLQKIYMREVAILSKSKHPAIIGFRGFSFVDQNKFFNPTIMLQLAEKGSLGDLIEGLNKGRINIDNTAKMIILYGMAQGMKYLHSLDVVHRDLKPDNVLLGEDYHPYITDFGSSRFFDPNDNVKQTENQGTPVTQAPESFQESIYNEKSDVYGYGMTCYWFLTGKTPFEEIKSQHMLYKTVEKGERPSFNNENNVPGCIIDLIVHCWDNGPDLRPTFSEIIEKFDSGMCLPNVDLDEYGEYCSLFQKRVPRQQPQQNNDEQEEQMKYLVFEKLLLKDQNIENIKTRGYYDQQLATGLLTPLGKNVILAIAPLDDDIVYAQFLNRLSIEPIIHFPSIYNFIGFKPYLENREAYLVFDSFTSDPEPKTLRDIMDRIIAKQNVNNYDNTAKANIVFGVAAGMYYLHSHGIYHRNLCTKIIYLDDDMHPILTNFTKARFHLSNASDHDDSDINEENNYWSPEKFEGKENIASQSDIYAFGCLIYELLTNQIPYYKEPKNKIKEQVLAGVLPKLPDAISSDNSYQNWIDLMNWCMNRDPLKRPSFEKIYQQLNETDKLCLPGCDEEVHLEYQDLISSFFL